MGAFDDLVPQQGRKTSGAVVTPAGGRQGGAFDDLIPAGEQGRSPKPKQQRRQRTQMEQAGHEVSYASRAALEGLGGGLDFFAEPLAQGLEAIGLPRQMRFSEIGGWVADKAGLSRPENSTERVISDVNRGLAGVVGLGGVGKTLAGAAQPAVRSVGNFLTAQPALQTVSAVTGSGAAGIARESGATPGGQAAAGIVGALAPGVGAAGTSALIRGAVRGGEGGRQNMLATLEDFRLAGTTPTVGQAAGNRRTQALESLLSRLPGSSGVIARKGEQQQAQIGARMTEMADGLAPRADAESAGRAIRQGITGDFDTRTRATVGRLYHNLDAQIPAGTRIRVDNALDVLDELNPDIAGAPMLSPMFQNGRINNIRQAFRADAAPPTSGVMGTAPPSLPYEAARKVRTLVGREVANANFASDVPVGDWRRLYGGLSDDMRGAAEAQGPQATRAYDRANRYFRAVEDRKDTVAHVVNRDTPESIFRAAMQGTEQGATTLRALMRSLPEKAKREMASAVLGRMGRAINSQQNAAGDAFSTQTFLTNWSKLSPEARSVLFDQFGPDFRRKVEAMTKVADNLRQGSKVYANPSGTAAASGQILAAGGVGGSLLAGSPTSALTILGGLASSNAMARASTNNNVVNWLARQTRAPIGSAVPLMALPKPDEKKRRDAHK